MRPRIRAATLTGYEELAASLGLDPDRLVVSQGMSPADLDVPDRWMPAGPVARLLELSAQRSGSHDFGLRLAEVRRLGTLGPLSLVLREEPTLRAALDLLIRHERVYNEALHMRMRADGDLTTVAMWLEFGEPAPTAQTSDLLMGALVGIIRSLVGTTWMPRYVLFAHEAPEDLTAHHRVFGPDVRFAERLTALVFPTEQSDLPVVASDASLRPYAQEYLRRVVVSGRAETATDQAAEAVEFLLPLGRCSLQQVSRHLGLRPRDLQRRLEEEGSSFSAVVQAERMRLAERNLPNGRFSMTEISQILGFAAPSAFSRWFSQHFGSSPSAWRSAARVEAYGTAGRSVSPAGTGRGAGTAVHSA
jgi:AraC-like DNA-binding protein